MVTPATLTIPKGKKLFPAIVLVHDSGPHDRDETMGVNKPFKDLAGDLPPKALRCSGTKSGLNNMLLKFLARSRVLP
ncbi:MAG: hypothetical protein N2V78_02475 [Methanophagales archaeon]|nr:hypothetical protein [Methanophagales archaeon]